MKKIILLTLLFTLSLAQYFTLDIDETGESTLFIFTNTITNLESGDEIGLFDLNGIVDAQGNIGELLVGTSTWTGEQLEIVAIGGVDLSDFGGPILPGYTGGTMLLRIWDSCTQTEHDAIYTTTFGSGTFNGLFSNIDSVTFNNGDNINQDCTGECFGDAIIDDCGVCNGNNENQDCLGECFGNAIIDDCGICNGNNQDQDCSGECFGDAIIDDCGVCNGNNQDQDCAGECFGGAELDQCGICNGSGADIECWDGTIVCDSNDCTDPPIYTNVDYESEIQSIFNANCTYYCHSNGGSYQGSLDLTSYDNVMSGNSDHGPIIIPEDSENSILIQKLSNNPPFGSQMPAYADPLDPATILLISVWIDEGALPSDDGSGGGDEDDGIGGGDYIEGCMDPIAENYNPDANVDDGTCTYAPMGELTFGAIDYTDNTLEINLDCEYDVSSFTFDLTGLNMIGYFGGTSEAAAFNINIEGSTVSGNATNDNIPANSGYLLTIIYDAFTADEICFSNSNITTYIGIEYEAILDDCLTIEGGDITLDIPLSAGWNWISVNAIQDNMDINAAFSTLPAQANDYIKSQTVAATYYDGYGWYPAFDIEVERMYLLNLADAGTMTYQGTPVNPLTSPIELASGWNWIGYIPQNSIGVNAALQNALLVSNDYIKSQTVAATYYPGYGFYPSFDMYPAAGYMLKVENSGSFIYPSEGSNE